MAVVRDAAAAVLPPSGDGYGDGSGYGSGYGDGSGYGYGEASAEYWPAAAAGLAGEAGQRALSEGATLAFWRSGKNGQPVNGGHGTRAAVGLVEELPPPLVICSSRALHASLAPWSYKGDRLWVVALYGEIQTQSDKLGALKREILAEVVPNPFVQGAK